MSYKYVARAWNNPEKSFVKDLMQQRVMNWRKQPSVLRIDKPTRLDRARRLGFKAKPGFVIARIQVRRSGLRRSRPTSGRRPKRMGVAKLKPAKSMQLIAEERTAKRFPNLEVLNSYWVWEDGRYKWFEVIMVDLNTLSDADKFKLGKTPTKRVFRGLTAAGKKVRGIQHKGKSVKIKGYQRRLKEGR